jgi:acyl-CoA reductase-like NAD-dependent aldehyde dehydrogenase
VNDTTTPLPCFVSGRPTQGSETLEIRDVTRGTLLARVTVPSPEDVEAAIAAAQAARPSMQAFPPDARRRVLDGLARRLRERAPSFVELLCAEAGKPLRDARLEVERAVETFSLAAEEAVRPEGEILELGYVPRGRGVHGFVRRFPPGPAALITPFNFPLNLVAHKVAPAVAAGVPFLLKPSERTPLCALALGDLFAETDLPSGSWSILPLPGARTAPLVEDERIAILSFTGGQVGWTLRARAGRKKVLLELGGNAACLVDADQEGKLTDIVPRVARGAFAQSGQSCISVQRVLVHERLYEPFRDRFVAAARALRLGDPHEEATDLGPLIDRAAAERIRSWMAEAREAGARLLAGGEGEGTMIPPTVFENVPHHVRLWSEEVFGPVAVLEPFRTWNEGIEAVNDSAYGLQAGLFTDSLERVQEAWEKLEVGGIVVNESPNFRLDAMPYGGVKRSGTGREGLRTAIRELTEPRLLVVRTVG